MRLAAQMKGGFYPAPREAVDLAATLLIPPPEPSFCILDPCAGEGSALAQLREILACPEEQTYAIELDNGRAEALRKNLPGSNILAPASFFGCRASFNSFSAIWLNPPFDHSYGGYRMESRFLSRATDWLRPGGVMALVCPEGVAEEYSDVRVHFARNFENCQIIPFPEKARRFDEVLVLGQKVRKCKSERLSTWTLWETAQALPGFRYPIPAGLGPRYFRKVEPTEPELQQMLAESPLRSHWHQPPETPRPSPPLPLGLGHIALLLASGHLDGLVSPPGQAPHVVRGTSRKRQVVSNVTYTENNEGALVKKTTLTERMELIVRTVDHQGTIRTFREDPIQEEPQSQAA